MSHAYFIDDAHKWVFEVWSGSVLKEDVREHVQRYVADPSLREAQAILVDVRTATFEAAIEQQLLEGLCEGSRTQTQLRRSVRVAVNPGANFWRVIPLTYLANDCGVVVIAFNHLVDGAQWLGIPYKQAVEGLQRAGAAKQK